MKKAEQKLFNKIKGYEQRTKKQKYIYGILGTIIILMPIISKFIFDYDNFLNLVWDRHLFHFYYRHYRRFGFDIRVGTVFFIVGALFFINFLFLLISGKKMLEEFKNDLERIKRNHGNVDEQLMEFCKEFFESRVKFSDISYGIKKIKGNGIYSLYHNILYRKGSYITENWYFNEVFIRPVKTVDIIAIFTKDYRKKTGLYIILENGEIISDNCGLFVHEKTLDSFKESNPYIIVNDEFIELENDEVQAAGSLYFENFKNLTKIDEKLYNLLSNHYEKKKTYWSNTINNF
ncbi:MAG: hypothetical protein FWF57_09900 [Defluviitaleaceae bacterium]|nr:hypothetical protein [Defluviitaleaceae bacterium]